MADFCDSKPIEAENKKEIRVVKLWSYVQDDKSDIILS